MRRFAVLSIAVVLAGCAPSTDGPTRASECVFTVAYRPDRVSSADGGAPPSASEPQLVGSWDGWQRPGPTAQKWKRVTDAAGEAWRTLEATLPAGTFQYAIVLGDRVLLDENNPRSSFGNDPLGVVADPLGTELSELVIPDCRKPALRFLPSPAPSGSLLFVAQFVRGAGGARLQPGSIAATLRRAGEALPAPSVAMEGAGAGERIVVRADGLPPGKYTVLLSAAADDGAVADALEASAFVEPAAPRRLEDGLIYQVMIDRFRAGSGPLAAPATPGDRAGGTLDGVRAAVEAGYFDRLGVSTLWLSPVYQNPLGYFTGRDGHLYRAYHGYWPSQPRSVEPLFGGVAALDALIAAAHARGLRIVLDAVPHHVHQQHPYYREHSRIVPEVAAAADPRTASWFHDGPSECVCGDPGCAWGAHLEECWFSSYLPNLELRNPQVLEVGVDDLLWWSHRFDLDGLRIDAVPMMPRTVTRRIDHALRAQVFRQGLDSLVIGEIYVGTGDEGRLQVRAYFGGDYDGLDSAFDFPLMWALRDVVAHGTGGFSDVENAIEAGDRVWAGSGATIARMVGNHDTTRFLSEAAGDAAGDPWTAAPFQPTDDTPYRRHLIGVAVTLTLPGLPVLYYGDELGLAGAGDPDSRRTLPDVLAPETLPAVERTTLDAVARLGRLRRCLPSLRRPSARVPLLVDDDRLIAISLPPVGEPDPALVVLSRAATDGTALLKGLPNGRYRDALSSRTFTVTDGTALLPVAALSVAVYLPEASACLE